MNEMKFQFKSSLIDNERGFRTICIFIQLIDSKICANICCFSLQKSTNPTLKCPIEPPTTQKPDKIPMQLPHPKAKLHTQQTRPRNHIQKKLHNEIYVFLMIWFSFVEGDNYNIPTSDFVLELFVEKLEVRNAVLHRDTQAARRKELMARRKVEE